MTSSCIPIPLRSVDYHLFTFLILRLLTVVRSMLLEYGFAEDSSVLPCQNYPLSSGSSSLSSVVWMGGWVRAAGELQVEMDTSHGLGKWTDFEIEVYETGAKVEWDIVEMLIDELVVDVLTWIGGFRV
ncbi:hypothetical protein L1987_05653 [Smallanthus sonchifolius]|uniref:Uncharacterized protein n=1 Tax=Smallanthus sonchifolius TaxID=185202 RepID=A0ACB9JVZ9_9ASTR|nr:hypothetical protein L1987_05653 [Smallanthus sonchifolius]